jgi:biotin carboxyl carrier protein
MRHSFTIVDTEHHAWLSRAGDGYRLHVEHRAVPVALEPRSDGTRVLRIGDVQHTVAVAVDGDVIHIHIDGETFTARYTDPISRYADASAGAADDVALAPMPGTVVAVHVQSGDRVEAGQTLVVIESMKLQTSIKAWRDGRVAALHVAKGEPFERLAPLVTLALA